LDEEQGARVNALDHGVPRTSNEPRGATPFTGTAAVLRALESDLRRHVRGEVRFDQGSKVLYASDASNYRQVPLAVVVPADVDDLLATLAACRRNDVPFLARGGGTSQNGQCVNVAVVADASKYVNRVVSIDPVARVAIVEPGVVCDTLRDAAEQHGLTFAPDPATHSRCTLGGMIANNSCGAHSVMAGKTVENVEALEIATFDGARFWVGPTSDDELARIIAAGGRQGEIYAALKELRDTYAAQIRAKFPRIKRRVSGFNLDQLLPENGFNVARALVGTEGTCALTLQAKVRLVKSPAKRVIVVLGFTDIYTAADAVPHFMRCGPIAIEGLDRAIIRGLQARGLKKDEIALLPEGDAWVVLEFGADTQDAALRDAQAAAAYFSSGEAGRTCRRGSSKTARCRRGCGRSARRERRQWRCPSIRASPIRWSAGKTRRSIRCASATICARSRRWWIAMATRRACTAISATAACTRASPSICAARKASRRGASFCARRRSWWSNSAARCRANMATARPRPSFCRSCTASN
jgi:FAD/FMN-containing dehydrogenase